MQSANSSQQGAIGNRFIVLLAILCLAGGAIYFIFQKRKAVTMVEAPRVVPMEVSRTNLVLTEGQLRLNGSTGAFAGFMLEHYADGSIRSRSSISNGLLNGLSQGWYTNGQMQVSEYFKDGMSDGLRTKWYADGTKQSEAAIAAGKLNGAFQRWHTNGVLSERVEFVDDTPVGTSTSWFPSGYLKARVTLKDGKPVEQTFWKDGEKKE